MGKKVPWVLALLLLPGCDPAEPPICACTESFDSIRFVAVNAQRIGEPGVTLFVMQLRTGALLDVAQSFQANGTYTVVDDSFIPRLHASGDTLLVLGAKDSRRLAARFVVGVDQPCSCHVHKIAGADSVSLE